MNSLYIDSVGLAAPGLPSWHAAKDILLGKSPYQPTPLEKYKPHLLPPNERRRATELIRLAFRVCEEAFAENIEQAASTMSVFASSGGDYHIIDSICRVLCESDRAISPTQFHNSVHNSAAGYWSIATKSTEASTSLSDYDHTFSAGLLEAATMANAEKKPVLLTIYDVQPPAPLVHKRQITIPFAVAFLLTTERNQKTMAKIDICRTAAAEESVCKSDDLETLRNCNPAARALPLLELMACKQTAVVNIKAGDESNLKIKVDL